MQTAAYQASLSFIVSWSLLKLGSIESVMPSSQLILCCPISACPQSFPASVFFFFQHQSFPVSRLFTSGGQSVEASASVLPVNIHGWFPLGLTGLISLLPKGLSRSPAPQFESINSSALSLLYGPTLISIHDYWKSHSFNYTDLFGKVISLPFNTLSRFLIAFLPRSKHLLISWLQSLSTVILVPRK